MYSSSYSTFCIVTLSQEYFERKRLGGHIAGAKRPHGPPMGIRYHRQTVSQDLLSLKTLSDVHDTEPCEQVNHGDRPNVTRQPYKIDLKQGRPGLNSSDFELPMSPITNPSVLELLDTSSGTESLYADQPRVSTTKKPDNLSLHPAVGSVFPPALKKHSLPQKFCLDLDMAESMNNLSTYQMSSFASKRLLSKPAVRESHLFTTYNSKTNTSANMAASIASKASVRSTLLDTERPLVSTLAAKSYQQVTKPSHGNPWENMEWYSDKSAQPPLLKKHKKTDTTISSSFHDREVR